MGCYGERKFWKVHQAYYAPQRLYDEGRTHVVSHEEILDIKQAVLTGSQGVVYENSVWNIIIVAYTKKYIRLAQ